VADNRNALGIWKLDERDGPVRDAGPYQKLGNLAGKGATRGEPGHAPQSKAYRFDGQGWIAIGGDGGVAVGPYTPHNDSLTFSPWESFTLQAWLKTEARDMRVILANPSEYCLLVNDGRLAAWLMEDGGASKEAAGSRNVADGRWHHVAAVVDRNSQRLSLYVDGSLDTADGAGQSQNPVDIASITACKWPASLTLGSLGGRHPFVGWLDEVSIFSGAMKPADFSLTRDYPSPYGNAAVRYMALGAYESPPCDWGVPARLGDLTIAADLCGGRVMVTIETSNDGFRTIPSQLKMPVRDGVNTYSLRGLLGTWRAVRVRFSLTPNENATATPVIDAFRITGNPGLMTCMNGHRVLIPFFGVACEGKATWPT
jgi:hypothetical protein